MDPDYYERQAATQLKKVAAETKKRGGYEKQAADLEHKAIRDDASAASTKSDSTRRSRLRSAEGNRKRAAELRKKAAAATQAAASAQDSANKFQEKASAERARRAAKAQRQADRDARDARRDAERERRERTSIDRDVSRSISALDATANELAAAIAASRRAAPQKITVLLMAGSPEGGAAPLRLDREAREIDAKVQMGKYRDQIELKWTQATQVRDIIDALNRFEPDVVHFSGHGDAGSLLFEGRDGAAQTLTGDELALLLQAAPRPIRLVVFNACQSAAQALAATDWAEFGIGMERPIADEAAKEWAGQFYGSLASGATVALAFEQATAHATVLTSENASGEPQLYARTGSDADATVLVSPSAEAAA